MWRVCQLCHPLIQSSTAPHPTFFSCNSYKEGKSGKRRRMSLSDITMGSYLHLDLKSLSWRINCSFDPLGISVVCLKERVKKGQPVKVWVSQKRCCCLPIYYPKLKHLPRSSKMSKSFKHSFSRLFSPKNILTKQHL